MGMVIVQVLPGLTPRLWLVLICRWISTAQKWSGWNTRLTFWDITAAISATLWVNDWSNFTKKLSMFCTSTSGTFGNIHLPKNFLDESMKNMGRPNLPVHRGRHWAWDSAWYLFSWWTLPTHPLRKSFLSNEKVRTKAKKHRTFVRERGRGNFWPKSHQRYLHYK